METSTPKTPREECLHGLAIDPLPAHRKYAARHPNTHIDDLIPLIWDRDYEVRHIALTHPEVIALHKEVLSRLDLPNTLSEIWKHIAVSLYLVKFFSSSSAEEENNGEG